MSDVSYPVPIRDVIIGGKTWASCHLSRVFRLARIKLMPDPPVTGYIPDLMPTQAADIIPNQDVPTPQIAPEIIDAVTDWAASSRDEQKYSPEIKRLHSLFDYYRHFGFKYLYLYTDGEGKLSNRAKFEFWTPSTFENDLNRLKVGYIHEVLIAMDLTKSFDSQIKTAINDTSSFYDWMLLRGKGIDCITPKQPASTRKHEEPPQTSALYNKLETLFNNNKGKQNKTMFVFINGYAELNFGFVKNHLPDWVEHDRMVKERGGGYAIMAFDLNRPFREQFPPHKYGHFNEGNREGLSYFGITPLINIPDRSGTKTPAEEEKRALHRKMLDQPFTAAWENPDADSLPRIRKKVPDLGLVPIL